MAKQERSRHTYERLLDAAAEEFARVGYADASLSEVAERAGVTKGALYGHFSSKRELAAVLRQHLGVTVEELLGHVPEGEGRGLDELGSFIRSVAERISDDVRFQAALRLADEGYQADGKPSALLDGVRTTSHTILREAKKAGHLDAALPVEPFADLVVVLLFGAYRTSGRHDGGELSQRVQAMWELLAGLVATEQQ
ncbi:TetR/AcrR family transcriptional regulator [Streptomyces chiangmaiensis]|uniref:TetR/AcrR family transcriptional regulator n=1 Tax=Streptomyces chiangmaiensis TaxID=766497 RepID=A0ABU7FK63_9ACTN|nr:TetR/AcrR family transcriptional regulator [Streptomyces chiangmaiensis]MED7824213.1 TetR/AcrR family transcriptional regulator [Streptomyces chiangmaiensis]